MFQENIKENKFDPEIQSMRDQLAAEIVDKKEKRDIKRLESKKTTSKLRGVFGLQGGAKELSQEADVLNQEAQRDLVQGKQKIEKRTEELEIRKIINNLDLLAEFFEKHHGKIEEHDLAGVLEIQQQCLEPLMRQRDFISRLLLGDDAKNLIWEKFNRILVMSFFERKTMRNNNKTSFIVEYVYFFVLDVIEQNLDKIAETATLENLQSKGKQELFNNSLVALYRFIEAGDERQKSLGTAVLDQKVDILEAGLKRGTTIFGFLVRQAFHYSQVQETREKIRDLICQSFFDKNISLVNEAYFLAIQGIGENEADGRIVLTPIFQKIGIDFDDLTRAWKSANCSSLADGLTMHFFSMRRIELERPGAINLLYHWFGIRDFGRYLEGMLLKQFREFDNLEMPYGIIIFPREDWNGAFNFQANSFVDFFEEIGNRYAVRIAECRTKRGIARLLIKLNKKYGKRQKIAFCIIGGHGFKNGIKFGSPRLSDKDISGDLYYLTSDDLHGRGVKRTEEYFTKDAPIILCSCSTGQEGGIAQKLSQEFGRQVIAPDQPSSMEHLSVEIDNEGKLDFRVKYRYDAGKSYLSGKLDIKEGPQTSLKK